MKLSAIRNDYLAYLQYELKVSKTTYTSYKSGLNRFVRFLTKEGMTDPDIETALSIPVLRKYNLQLGKKGLAAASVHGAFDPIQSSCVYLVNNDVLEDNPSKKIVLPQRKKTSRTIVSDIEVEALFDACERYHKDKDVAGDIGDILFRRPPRVRVRADQVG